jgi:hypothetical protein
LLKTAFHVHTNYSDDCNASPEDIVAAARRAGIGCVAITDHDTLDGAIAMTKTAGDLRVIVGEEISTTDGHLIGLFLRERVEPGLAVRETAERIRDQGGLVIAPHPFNSIFGCGLREKVYEILDLLDATEICNAQNLLPRPNRRSRAFAREHGLTPIVGVDMHHRDNLDACYQWLEPFDGPQSFLGSLRNAHFVTGRHSLAYFAVSAYAILRQRVGLGLPASYGRNAARDRKARRLPHGAIVTPVA